MIMSIKDYCRSTLDNRSITYSKVAEVINLDFPLVAHIMLNDLLKYRT